MKPKLISAVTLLFSLVLSCSTTTAQNTWQQITPTGNIPEFRNGSSMVTIDKLVYLFGGINENKSTHSILNNLSVYDAEYLKWDTEEATSVPPPARSSHKTIVYDGKMYVFFGLGANGALNNIWEYNPVTKQWTQITPASTNNPPARYDHSVILVGDLIYIVGGKYENGSLNDCWSFNLATRQWVQHPNVYGGGIYGHVVAQYNGNMILFGGMHNGYLDNALNIFNPGNNAWTIESPQGTYPNPFAYASYAQIGTQVFVMGGVNSQGVTGKSYVWDLATNQFSQLADGPVVSNAAITLAPGGNTEKSTKSVNYQKLILFGGTNGETSNNNTWVYTTNIEIPYVPPTVSLTVSPASISEDLGTSTVTVTLSAIAESDVTVSLAFSGTATGNGTDYNVSASSIVITAGNTTGTVTITAVQDTGDEPNETVIIDITDVVNATESGTQQQTITITDDDPPLSVEPQLETNIRVYPNPTRDYLTISIGEQNLRTGNFSFQLCDISGKIFRTQSITEPETTVDIAGQKTHVFLLRIVDGNKLVKVFKLVK